MFTKEQLAKWESDGFTFPSEYKDWAVEEKKKIIAIKSVSSATKNGIIYFNVSLGTKGLINKVGTLVLVNAGKSIIRGLNVQQPYLVEYFKVSKDSINLNFSIKISDSIFNLLASSLEVKFIATCDEISVNSKIFNINNPIQSTVEKKCMCKNSWSDDDLKYIISEIRKRDYTGMPQKLRDYTNTKSEAMGETIEDENGKAVTFQQTIFDSLASDNKKIGERLFYRNLGETLQSKEKAYSSLAKWIQYIFKNTKATKCINKIQLLAQIYVETAQLTATYEGDDSAAQSGEDFYRGRGLVMVTHSYNYEEFYEYLYKEKPTEDELKTFVPKLAESIEFSAKSAVWYLNKRKIQDYFNEDNVNNVSAAINYPKALRTKNYDPIKSLPERAKYFNLIKEVINYDQCK